MIYDSFAVSTISLRMCGTFMIEQDSKGIVSRSQIAKLTHLVQAFAKIGTNQNLNLVAIGMFFRPCV